MSAVTVADASPSTTRWSTTVGCICHQYNGEVQTGPFGSQLHASDYCDDGTPVVMPQDLKDGKITTERIARVGARHVSRLKQHKLRAGDIVYSRRGDVGRFAVVSDSERDWLCGTGCIRIRLNCPDLDIAYVRRYLQQPSVEQWLRHHAKGVTMPNLNTAIIRALPFVYPPLSEQRRIAAVLDQADALRAKRRATIQKLDELTQSTFLDMFGDPVTNPKGWPTKSLLEVAARKPNNGIFRKNDEYCGDGAEGLPVVWVEELFRGDVLDVTDSRRVAPKLADIARYGLKHGDVLFCRSSLKLDGIAYNNVYLGEDDAAMFECHIIRLSPKRDIADPVYLNHVFRTPQMRAAVKSKSKTATMTTIDQAGLGSIALPIPPISMQRAFNLKTKQLATLKTTCKRHLHEIDSLFASLQHRAFRGGLKPDFDEESEDANAFRR